jgi:hypothetical protein
MHVVWAGRGIQPRSRHAATIFTDGESDVRLSSVGDYEQILE